jgi:chloramphenicol O-acetyltransferase
MVKNTTSMSKKRVKPRLPTKEEEEEILNNRRIMPAQEFYERFIKPYEESLKAKKNEENLKAKKKKNKNDK